MRQIVSEDRGVIDRVGQESVGGVGLQAPEVADYGSPRRVLARRPLIMRPKQIFGSTLAWGYDGCMRLNIDATRRQGHGRCYEFAPEVIRPNDEGHADLVATTRDVRPEDEKAVEAVVRNWPSSSPGDQGTPRGDE